MSEGKIDTTKGLCVVALTRHIMEIKNMSLDDAYKELMATELYSLLMDTGTRLFLEPNDYLCQCLDKELDEGIDSLYRFINIDD